MLLLHYGRPSVCTVRMMSEMLTPLSDSRHTKAECKFTPQICRSRIFVPANECTRVVPMYPSQSAMSHLHSLAQSMYIATFLPKHVIPTCFADYVTSTSGAIRLAFDLSPWPQVFFTSLACTFAWRLCFELACQETLRRAGIHRATRKQQGSSTPCT